MPLYIRNDEVDTLATRLQHLTKARTKTDAVRLALQHEIKRRTDSLLPSERIGKALAMVATIRAEAAEAGHKRGGEFDMKAFTDDMWDV